MATVLVSLPHLHDSYLSDTNHGIQSRSRPTPMQMVAPTAPSPRLLLVKPHSPRSPTGSLAPLVSRTTSPSLMLLAVLALATSRSCGLRTAARRVTDSGPLRLVSWTCPLPSTSPLRRVSQPCSTKVIISWLTRIADLQKQGNVICNLKVDDGSLSDKWSGWNSYMW